MDQTGAEYTAADAQRISARWPHPFEHERLRPPGRYRTRQRVAALSAEVHPFHGGCNCRAIALQPQFERYTPANARHRTELSTRSRGFCILTIKSIASAQNRVQFLTRLCHWNARCSRTIFERRRACATFGFLWLSEARCCAPARVARYLCNNAAGCVQLKRSAGSDQRVFAETAKFTIWQFASGPVRSSQFPINCLNCARCFCVCQLTQGFPRERHD